MTTGQKIAARRKELELSQEALGDKLGVSRQTVYKWESDLSLPDIDKLVALSRLFQVPVGWLLGVEEEPEPQSVDFSPEQLKLLEEILGRYQRAEPEELSEGQRKQVEELVGRLPKKRRRWPWAAAGLAALVIAMGGVTLFQRLDQMDRRYYELANSVGNVTSSVNRQIGSITDRVEEVLKAQNGLAADYGTQLRSADLAANTVAFSLRVVPKTYTPGMSVIFLADNGEETLEFPAQEEESGAFTGEATCPLTDVIALSAVFIAGDARQTQLLDQYENLYQNSFPSVGIRYLEFALMTLPQSLEGTVEIPESFGLVVEENSSEASKVNNTVGRSWVKTVRMGLFQNQKLVAWMERCEKPESWDAEEGGRCFRLDPQEVELEEGDTLCFAAQVTDQYGRSFMVVSYPDLHVVDGKWSTGGSYSSDPADWDFTT